MDFEYTGMNMNFRALQRLLYATTLLLVSISAECQLTNSVQLMRDTVFSLSKANGSVAGDSSFLSNEIIYRKIAVSGTNRFRWRVLPFNQAYEFRLLDERGNEVQKRPSQQVTPNKQANSSGELRRLPPQVIAGDDIRPLFRPEELFVISNSGKYQLEVYFHAVVNLTNGAPDYTAMRDPKKFFKNNIGLIKSPPIRVMVIKE